MKKLFLMSMVVFVMGCYGDRTYKLYMVPMNYEGPLVMIEDTLASEKVPRIGDTLIFDFRKSTVLHYKGHFVEGLARTDHFMYRYVNPDGSWIKLSETWGNEEKLDSLKPYNYHQHARIGTNGEALLITKPMNFDRNFAKLSKVFDSLFAVYYDKPQK